MYKVCARIMRESTSVWATVVSLNVLTIRKIKCQSTNHNILSSVKSMVETNSRNIQKQKYQWDELIFPVLISTGDHQSFKQYSQRIPSNHSQELWLFVNNSRINQKTKATSS